MTPLALLIPFAQAAPCADPVPGAAMLGFADRAQAAFAEMDGAGFDAAVAELRAALPCLGEPLTPPQAARVHFTLGLDGYLARDTARSVPAFQSAQAADPALDPESWLPETHPLHQEWRFAQGLETPPPDEIAPPDGIRVFADGADSRTLPSTRPAVLQRVGGGDLETLLWVPGDALPPWAPPAPAKLSAAARRHIWLGSATVALAGTATGLLLASDAMNQRYNDPETPYGELAGLDEGVQRTSTAAIITGSVGVVTGAALVITW